MPAARDNQRGFGEAWGDGCAGASGTGCVASRTPCTKTFRPATRKLRTQGSPRRFLWVGQLVGWVDLAILLGLKPGKPYGSWQKFNIRSPKNRLRCHCQRRRK